MDRRDFSSEEIVRYDDAPEQISIPDLILPPDNPMKRLVFAVLAIAIALASAFPLASWASSAETYADTIAALDEKRNTVMQLVAGSTATSALITAIPDDVGTPIAEKLLDLGADFAIVIGAIYLEKYLLTILGLVAFRILVPASCVLFLVAVLGSGYPALRDKFLGISARLFVFGLMISIVVPASVYVSRLIENTYQSTLDAAVQSLEQPEEVSSITGDATTQVQSEATQPQSGFNGFFQGVGEFFGAIPEAVQSIPGALTESARKALDWAQAQINLFIETLAVMIVTSCVIPILVLSFFLWLAKTILGVRIDVPISAVRPRSMRRLHS
jgi:hypothetical protein